MRKRQPNGAELKQAGSSGIEDAASDVDMRYGIAIEQDVARVVRRERKRRRWRWRRPIPNNFIFRARAGD